MASTRSRGQGRIGVVVLFAAVLAVVALLVFWSPSGTDVEGPAGADVEGPVGGEGQAEGEGSTGEGGLADEGGSVTDDGVSLGETGLDVAPVVPLPSGLSEAPVERNEYAAALDVPACARRVVEGYREAGAVLVRAGWVDLLGRVWGCVVSGPGWVDVCLVREVGDAASEVEVARMEVEAWGRSYATE